MTSRRSPKRASEMEGSRWCKWEMTPFFSPVPKKRMSYILQYHFFDGTYQNTLGTHLFQRIDDLPKRIPGDYRMHRTPPFLGQWKDRWAAHSRQNGNDLFQFVVRGVEQDIFIGTGMEHRLDPEQDPFEYFASFF